MAAKQQHGTAAPPTDADNPGGFKHVPALDGIRGLAILMVLAEHLLWSNQAAATGPLVLFTSIAASLWSGVNLFFTLSGFLITGILIDTLGVPHYFKTFYMRRTLRIFPLYYGVYVALLLLTRPLHFVWSGWQYLGLLYVANLFQWRQNAPLDLGVFNINHFWSLQSEEQFYLLWPWIVGALRKPMRILATCLVGCVLVLSWRVVIVALHDRPFFSNPYLVYSFTPSCADGLLFGGALAAVLRTRWRPAVLRAAPVALAVFAAPLLVYGLLHRGLEWVTLPGQPQKWFMPTVGFTLLDLCAVSVIALAVQRATATSRVFSLGWLRFFGRYSYGIYVFHYSLTTWLTPGLRAFILRHTHSKLLGVVGGALVVSVVSVVVAVAVYHLYEKHFLHLKRFFEYASSARRTPAAELAAAKTS